MFKLDTEDQLLEAFRPRDRKHVELAPEVKLPLFVRDYVAWTHPAGGRVYVVFSVPGGVPTGLVFDTDSGGGPPVPHMCDWCHHTGLGNQVGMLSAYLNARKRVGVLLCRDLGCKDRIEEQASRGGYSARPHLEKLVQRMGRFASDALKIDLTGAGR